MSEITENNPWQYGIQQAVWYARLAEKVGNLQIKVAKETKLTELCDPGETVQLSDTLAKWIFSPVPPESSVDELEGLLVSDTFLAGTTSYWIDLKLLGWMINGNELSEEAELLEGSELLHLIIYLQDCKESGIEPSLPDFVNEFLLDPETDDQEGFFVYQELIRQQDLLETRARDIIMVGNKNRDQDDSEMFIPLMLFFKYDCRFNNFAMLDLLNFSNDSTTDSFIYALLCELNLVLEKAEE